MRQVCYSNQTDILAEKDIISTTATMLTVLLLDHTADTDDDSVNGSGDDVRVASDGGIQGPMC